MTKKYLLRVGFHKSVWRKFTKNSYFQAISVLWNYRHYPTNPWYQPKNWSTNSAHSSSCSNVIGNASNRKVKQFNHQLPVIMQSLWMTARSGHVAGGSKWMYEWMRLNFSSEISTRICVRRITRAGRSVADIYPQITRCKHYNDPICNRFSKLIRLTDALLMNARMSI